MRKLLFATEVAVVGAVMAIAMAEAVRAFVMEVLR